MHATWLPPACPQDTISKQVLSTVARPPGVHFGTSKRSGMAEKSVAPGPGAYRLKPVMGALPRAGPAARMPFASCLRWRLAQHFRNRAAPPAALLHRACTAITPSTAPACPAPGPVPSAVGDTVESTRSSAPRMKFGSGTRDQANRLFISTDHEKCQVGGWPGGGALLWGVAQ